LLVPDNLKPGYPFSKGLIPPGSSKPPGYPYATGLIVPEDIINKQNEILNPNSSGEN
jgi:hypothetical protein